MTTADRPRFHDLDVVAVRHTIRDAVEVTLLPRNPDVFAFQQGQYLTFRQTIDGVDIRRSYSISAGLDDGHLQIGIKKVDGGAFSSWANSDLSAGDILQAMPPMGSFFAALHPDMARHYLFFAGGSGITPVLSNIRTILAREPLSRVTLIYANRRISAIMFRDELEDLKNLHMQRLAVTHVLEQDTQEIALFTGRVDQDKCAAFFAHWIDIASVDLAFICGPRPMMLAIVDALKSHGLTDDRIRFELFTAAQPGRLVRKPRDAAVPAETVEAQVTLDGATHTISMSRDQNVLEAVLKNALDAPFGCRAGVCSTCRCRLVEGEVDMIANHALEDYEVSRGYRLSCQSYPVSDRVVISYDG